MDHALMLLLREGPDNPVFDYQARLEAVTSIANPSRAELH
jgi:hypothetical protein